MGGSGKSRSILRAFKKCKREDWLGEWSGKSEPGEKERGVGHKVDAHTGERQEHAERKKQRKNAPHEL